MKSLSINEVVLCILRISYFTDDVEMNFIEIENEFEVELDELKSICYDTGSSLEDLIQFLQFTPEFDVLSNHYRYCKILDGAFQAFTANNADVIPIQFPDVVGATLAVARGVVGRPPRATARVAPTTF